MARRKKNHNDRLVAAIEFIQDMLDRPKAGLLDDAPLEDNYHWQVLSLSSAQSR